MTMSRLRPTVPTPLPEATIASNELAWADDGRIAMIAEHAYYRAQCRGFVPGYEVEDWLAAERQIDALLAPDR